MTSPHVTVKEPRQREQWVDNLRVVLIAGVIVAHTATAYVVDIPWYYDDEQTASGVWSVIVGLPTFVAGAFGLGPLFLVAGWFSTVSMARRGAADFVRSRLLRLGLPLLVFVLLLQPLTDYIGNLRSERGSFAYYLGMTEVSVMWFVAALLVFSLAYAGLRVLRPSVEPGRLDRPAALVPVAATAIAVSSFTVWQIWPWNAEVFLNLRFGEWPQAAVLFALGVRAGETGWLKDVPAALVRRIGWLAAAAALALAALLGIEAAWGDVDVLLDATAMGPTIVFAVLDGLLAVTWTLWCVAWFRRRWTSQGPAMNKASRASYATYVIHPLVLTTLMVVFAAVVLPPVLKFVVISVAGVPACFAVGYGLTRVPGISKVL
ncbi:MAG TPA: acyltransferase family protein [Streptosporangiaceae bacterium]